MAPGAPSRQRGPRERVRRPVPRSSDHPELACRRWRRRASHRRTISEQPGPGRLASESAIWETRPAHEPRPPSCSRGTRTGADLVTPVVRLEKRSSPGSAATSWLLRTTTDCELISGLVSALGREAAVDRLGVPGCCGCAAQNGDLRAAEWGCRARNRGKSLRFVAMWEARRALGRARACWCAAISRGRRMRVAVSENRRGVVRAAAECRGCSGGSVSRPRWESLAR
jgi:hypothetical protein